MNPLNLQQLSMLSFMRMPGEGCLKVPPGLLWIAQMPQGAGRIAAPRHLRILHGIGDRGRVRQARQLDQVWSTARMVSLSE